MSQFDQYSSQQYAEKLRLFIGNDVNFSKSYMGAEDGTGKEKTGPLQSQLISDLENSVNTKAAQAEANDSTLGERLKIARDYKGLR